ncbi:hypothetical protein GQ600_13531 [Phytophthora cactorum]|nr:hypothetical protein GQ600_13531 [Phytophthora cactorum]
MFCIVSYKATHETTEEDTEGLWIGTAGSYGRRWDGVPEIPLFHHGAAGSPSRKIAMLKLDYINEHLHWFRVCLSNELGSDAVYCRRPNRPDANALIHAGIYPNIGLYVGSVFGVRYFFSMKIAFLSPFAN